uniref:Uncharacterized protein n=1 Tax=Arundo donax TaxID=35708 RepID=A0A0A9SD73_ARUDO
MILQCMKGGSLKLRKCIHFTVLSVSLTCRRQGLREFTIGTSMAPTLLLI